MAIANIQIGRVESDPMAVPVATTMRRAQGERFDRLLRAVDANEDTPSTEVPEATTDDGATEATAAAAPTDPDEAREQEPVAEEPSAARTAPTDAEAEPTVDNADVTASIRRGEPDQQEQSAGKGTDSPRTSIDDGESLVAARLQTQSALTQTPANGGPAQPAAPTTPARGDALVRGAAGLAETAAGTPAARRAHAGYATRSVRSAEMLEQARDSVFKQILMKLNNDGGEVRMRLQPPDLGELDLRMTVEGGNKLTLAIAAERHDMMQLLQRHLDALKQALQAGGLEIAGAEVQTRSEFERGQHGGELADGGSEGNESSEDAASDPRTRGYVTAEGLDFWV